MEGRKGCFVSISRTRQSFEEKVLRRKKTIVSTSAMVTPAIYFDMVVEPAAQTCKLHPCVFAAKVREAEAEQDSYMDAAQNFARCIQKLFGKSEEKRQPLSGTLEMSQSSATEGMDRVPVVFHTRCSLAEKKSHEAGD